MSESIFLKNVEQMQSFASEFAKNFVGGEIYTFSGDLGAGKTTFIQGILKSLGASGPFTSPTFTIVNEYNLNKTFNKTIDKIYHIDAYRISSKDLENIGFGEMIQNPNALVLIEWPEKIQKSLPSNCINISLKWDENGRFLTINNPNL